MKKLLFLIVLGLGFLNTSAALGQVKYKVEYFVTIRPYTGDAAGNANMFFGGNVLYSEDNFNFGPGNLTRSDDYVLNSATVITSYESQSLREPVPGDGGCTLTTSNIPYNNLTTSSLTTAWGCVPNMSGRFNVQRIQDLEVLNPSPRQLNPCDPAQVRVAIASMAYELQYFNIDTSQWVTFPGYEYPQEVNGRPQTHPGNATLDLNLISNINSYGVLQIRVKYSDDNSNISAPIGFNMVPCEIELDGSANNPREIDPNCFGSRTGGFEVRFERELETNETLIITLDIDRTGNGIYEPYDPASTGTLTTSDLPGGVYEFIGLEEGDYQIAWALGDVNGGVFAPSDPVSINLTQPSELSYSLTNPVMDITCIADGQINITPSGGGGNYRYEWRLNGNATVISNTRNLSTSIPGDYVLRLFDADVVDNSCFIELAPINIGAPPAGPLITLVNLTTPSPVNGGKGSISVSVSGTGSLTYDWRKDGISFTPVSPSTDDNLVDLDPGDYTLRVTDSNGCVSEEPPVVFSLPPLPPLTVNITQTTPIRCEGDTTTLTANGEGGAGSYSYVWSTGETTETIQAGVGIYSVTVTDVATTTADSTPFNLIYVDGDGNPITNPLAVTVSNNLDILCRGENTGRITLDISGGTGTYEVFWDGSLTAGPQDNSTLSFGNHSYEVRDGNCIVAGGPIFIDEPADNPSISVDFSSDVTTNGGSDGRITVSVQGGTPPYTYLWEKDNAPFTPTSDTDLMNLTAGVYELTLRDNNGIVNSCEVIESITIGQPGPLQINNPPATVTDVGCFGESSGRIDASYEGTPNFEFVWFDELGSELKRGPDDFIDNLPAGIYSYTVNDASNAGPLPSGDIVIAQPSNALTASLTQTEVTCFGDTNGTITVTAMGGTAPIQYAISGGFALQPTPGSFTNLAAGTYTITVTDANLCSIAMPLSATLAPPEQITFDDSNAVTPVSTAGASDGSVSLAVQGGAQPYFYRWNGPVALTPVNTANTTTIENLPVGDYTLEVSNTPSFNIDGCYFTKTYTVSEQATILVSITNQQNPCLGQTNGSITAAVAGTGPYSLQWSDTSGPLAGETGLTLENIGAGTYTLNVTDNGTVPATVGNSPAVVLVEPQEITADTNTTPSCAATGTGTIVISNIQGGEPGNPQNYTYSIDGTTFQNNPLFENLTAQTYSVWIRDGNGCDGIFSGITVTPSAAILWDEPNTIVTNATAQGASDGTITLAFTSDATNYTYEWNGPGTVDETTQNLTGKAAGVYTVIITNEDGCTLERIFTIAEPGLLTITINSTKNPCFGENNGNIQTTVVGTGTLSYQWSEAVLGDLAGETNPNLNNAPAGTYTLTVTDNAVIPANMVSSNPITLSDPVAALDAIAAPTDAQCAGEANGSVTITASGGIPPYEYSIDGGATYQASATFNSLGLGSYSFRVRDSNDCITDALATINEPPAITLSFVSTPLSAAGASDGAIDIAASGGTGDLNFSWVGPAGFTPTTDEDITGLTAGDYTVTVTDENGCTLISNPITIDEPGAIVITLTLNEEILCNGDEFGEIMADVEGGVPDYTYQWFQEGNNTPLGETTNLISNLGAGNYFLRVTDANGISRDSNTLTITEPEVLQVTLQNKVDIICSGESTGAINIAVQGGTAPYSFQWNNGADSQNLANIAAGDYFVEVFDDNGCFELLEVTINPAPDALQLDATVTNVSEYLANDGSIALNITGGATPYTINWMRNSDNAPAGNTATISALAADTYTVSVSDANGCGVTETYEVTQPDIVEDTIVQPSCQGDTNGSISVLVNQGNGSFTYLWSTGETTNAITNLGAGNYSVTITGFGEGPLTRTYTLVDPLPLLVDLGENRVLCVDQVLELDATVEDDTATYAWSSDNGFSSSDPAVTLTTTGNYTVTVQTASGCTAVGTLFLEVSTDEINAEFAMSSQVFTGDILVAVDISFPLPDVIEWDIPEGATVVKQDSDEVELVFNQAGEYEITVTTRRGDCIAQKTKKVLVVAKDGSVDQGDESDPNKVVEDFLVYPNPTTGRFTADVSLTEPGNISIKVFNFANNAMMASERGRGNDSYSIPFDISGMPSGVYAVLLETPYGTSLRKIVVR